MRHVLSAALALLLVGCSDGSSDEPDGGGPDVDATDPPDAPPGSLVDRLRALPGVESVDEVNTEAPGYRAFAVTFDQPVDHDAPDGPHFTQHLTLLHLADDAPMVLATTGYGNYYASFRDPRFELTELLSANQLIIEHRYFKPSRPEPTDWSLLTVEQSARDHHAIAEAFHAFYTGSWVSTGASKGGMTSIYHRRFFPDDVDATVAYVGPHSLGPDDVRYDAWFDEVLPADCLARVHAFQVDLLANRRDAMLARAAAQAGEDGHLYTRVSLGAALESAVSEVEWAFFQYVGVEDCDALPTTDEPDDDFVFSWLDYIGGPSGFADARVEFFEPYYYQASAELGYPSSPQEHLEGLLQYTAEDFAGTAPEGTGDVVYDGAAMLDVGAWVRDEAERTMFIYGEYDPWTAGAFDRGDNAALPRFDVATGTHGSDLLSLAPADREEAFGLLEDWLGVAPVIPPERRRAATPPREPHLPLRALRPRGP